MNIIIESRRKASSTLLKKYPEATIVDVTSKGNDPFVRLSPFYPHGDIPVPFSEGYYSFSAEGVWQALKVFHSSGIDLSKLEVKNMKGIKRTVRKFGTVLGHQKGVNSDVLLGYLEARNLIYVPTYFWTLQHKSAEPISQLVDLASKDELILLDYNTNGDLEDLSSPLSHAQLIKRFIMENYN